MTCACGRASTRKRAHGDTPRRPRLRRPYPGSRRGGRRPGSWCCCGVHRIRREPADEGRGGERAREGSWKSGLGRMPAAGSPQGAGRFARAGTARRRNPPVRVAMVWRYGRAREGKRRRANRIDFIRKRKGVFGGGGRGNARKRSEPGFKTEGRYEHWRGIFYIRSYGI